MISRLKQALKVRFYRSIDKRVLSEFFSDSLPDNEFSKILDFYSGECIKKDEIKGLFQKIIKSRMLHWYVVYFDINKEQLVKVRNKKESCGVSSYQALFDCYGLYSAQNILYSAKCYSESVFNERFIEFCGVYGIDLTFTDDALLGMSTDVLNDKF